MENTPELKSKFFALYWGKEIYYNDVWGEEEGFDLQKLKFSGTTPGYGGVIQRAYMELKHLSQITDEDAIEVAKIIDWLPLNEGGEQLINSGLLYEFKKEFENLNNWESAFFADVNIADFLRSKGYALPFLGISVEQMIKWGWMKLKD